NLEAKEAYEGGGTILTNPFKLIQGGVGMGGRSAVILKNGDKEELWGLVTVTIDYDNLMEVLKLDNMEGMGVDYELSYFDDNGERHLLQMAGDPDEHAVTTRFRVRNLSWELRVSPQKGWISFWRVFISAAILLLVSILAGLFTSTLLKLRESNATLHRLSVTDGLTGSLNRRAYEEALAEIAKAPADKDFIYISADLNGLKHTNDTYGHPAGDELINGAKDCLQEIFSACGKVYRTGGDEFVALIYADEKSVEGLIEKLHALTKEWKGEGVNELSLSVGYSSYREFPEATMEQLIKTADERMYEQKRAYYQANGYDRRKH
ncbi:MAG: sensor domain-containing diguanylate cyclase, partial [Lachnospiraceae bacterium]|nr:sensor domain-containing diguanylate cyclase [Lachnospiraceae bacterium]